MRFGNMLVMTNTEMCERGTDVRDQGNFSETVMPDHQLHWIIENSKLVRAANGVSSIVEAMKIASAKHDFLR